MYRQDASRGIQDSTWYWIRYVGLAKPSQAKRRSTLRVSVISNIVASCTTDMGANPLPAYPLPCFARGASPIKKHIAP